VKFRTLREFLTETGWKGEPYSEWSAKQLQNRLSDKKVIAVFGGTSKQGTSVIKALLSDGKYAVRALTRNTDSAAAKYLAKLGATLHVIPENYSRDDLKKAFTGAYGVFGMTPVIPPERWTDEIALGKLQGDAALEVGIKHFVWSSLPNANKLTNDKFNIPHFTAKAIVEDYLYTLKGITVTAVVPAYFMTNFLQVYPPRADPDGTLVFSVSMDGNVQAPWVDITTWGPIVAKVFDDPKHFASKSLAVVGEVVSMNDWVKIFSEVSGKKAKFVTSDRNSFVSSMPPEKKGLANEIVDMYEYTAAHGYYAPGTDFDSARKIAKLRNVREFLVESGWKGEPYSEWNAKQTQ